MTWQTIDFHGIMSLDKSIIDQLHIYLDEKEAQLSQSIANTILLRPEYLIPSVIINSDNHQRIYEGMDIFAWKINQAKNNPNALLYPEEWPKTISMINQALWDYVELLEGGVVELFQQLDQVGFEQWRNDLIEVVESLRNILSNSIDDMKWACNRLEDLLWDYRAICQKRNKVGQFIRKKIFFLE